MVSQDLFDGICALVVGFVWRMVTDFVDGFDVVVAIFVDVVDEPGVLDSSARGWLICLFYAAPPWRCTVLSEDSINTAKHSYTHWY